MSSNALYKQYGVIHDGAGPAFGNVMLGHSYSTATAKDRILIIDSTSLAGGATANSGLANSSHAEQYALNTTVAEKGVAIVSTVASTAGAVQKVALDVTSTSAATGAVYGINAVTQISGTQTGATIYGVQSQAVVPVGTDGTVTGLLSVVYNSGSAVTGLGALSKIGLVVTSGGVAKNSAYIYCVKTASLVPINATHGICVDTASVDTSAFAVTSGSTPTLLWARDAAGKRLVNVTAPAAGGGPFAGGAASHITIQLKDLTTAADAASAAIVVNTTAVTAASRIYASVIAYAGTYATNGLPIVCLGAIVAGTSFAFQIVNAGTAALSGQITIAFTIEN